jgi:acetyltransferase-like isoleucine patch superfamily enzyme
VVTRDVPARKVALGVPAKVVREVGETELLG